VGKIALLRPDPAHDADPGNIFDISCSLYFIFRYRSRNIIAAPELRRNFFISLPDAEPEVRVVNIIFVTEPHLKCGPRSTFFTTATFGP
jgi:hypothetical protein